MNTFGPRGPAKPTRAKGIRLGMKVRCPWCERSGVPLTRTGLAKHKESDLDLPGTPICEGTGKHIAISDHGKIIKGDE